jgi:hypothetical protein
MSTDSLLAESLLSLSEAGRTLPQRPSPVTMWRWSRRGIRGIRLESILIGGRRFTSREALGRFIAARSGGDAAGDCQLVSGPAGDGGDAGACQ